MVSACPTGGRLQEMSATPESATESTTPPETPPRWRALLRELAVRPSKGKGQNFLTDRGIVARIADAATLAPGMTAVEIGPGLGILTAELLERVGPEGRVIAVELDRRLAAHIREEFGNAAMLTVIEGDVLRQPLATILEGTPEGTPYALVANLPYNITSAVLRHFLDDPRRPASLTVMVQREVAERIVARPPEMSILAVAIQFYGTPQIAMRIGPGAFIPRPKIESAVLHIATTPTPPLPEAAIPGFFAIVAAGFGQKRKQLANSLTAGLPLPKETIGAALAAAGLASARRAETLSVPEWLALHAALAPLLPA
jgi:16S rRNA (adenine1518-N6/adenine1519-N6)-dimethyltransferase